MLIARGIATAVAPESGLTDVQAELLDAIASALTGRRRRLPGARAARAGGARRRPRRRDLAYRQRIVHHMVLGELVLRPLPPVVAHRVAQYAEALGVEDDFVRVARRYAQGAYGLAWMDLQRSGFVDHVRDADRWRRGREADAGRGADPFEPARSTRSSRRPLGARSRSCPAGTLGRGVWEMYDGRGFALPGCRRRRARVPRPARLRARARRLRHEPQGRARGVRVHRAGRPRPEGLRVARDADRPVRDRLHRRHRVLRARRPRAQHPGAGHARSASPTPSGAARSCASATASTSSTSTTTSSRPRPSTRSARCCGSRRSRERALDGGSAGRRSTSKACRRSSGSHADVGEGQR